jgi:hypothetical protein
MYLFRLIKGLLWLIRFILFIPISFLVVGFIFKGFDFLMSWMLSHNSVVMLIILFVIGSLVITILKHIIVFISVIAASIAPVPYAGPVVIMLTAVGAGIYTIFHVWSILPKLGIVEIFFGIMGTIIYVGLTKLIIYGGLALLLPDDELSDSSYDEDYSYEEAIEC